MASKMCSICGKPSGMYPLCPECFKLKDEGKIIKCEDCGTWHYANKTCQCKISKNDIDNNKAVNENSINCIICGNESNGMLFCKECYYKYKNKILLIKITNCRDIELMDESYEGKYTCTDGHVVKSKSERDIDNYLFLHGIAHAYEKALPIDGEKKNDLHPDFYLPTEKVYIEHWGFDESNKAYSDSKEYKIKKYKEKGITLICTNEKDDASDIETALTRKLDKNNYKIGEINFI